jgi:hypothetical protein
VLEAATQPCALKLGLCIAPGSRSTIAVASAPMAAATPADKPGKAPPPVPRFSRAASVASSAAASDAASSTGNAPWTLEIGGTLKHAAWAGNALFLFFDLEDPEAVDNRQFTALYQAALRAGARLATRFSLSPEEGFRPGHTYRLRIVQLINGREVVLGETDLSLL